LRRGCPSSTDFQRAHAFGVVSDHQPALLRELDQKLEDRFSWVSFAFVNFLPGSASKR
jgi:uncharacterized protein (DUF2249 family)